MDEKNLLTLWNTQRSQIIHSQLTSGIVLIGILALATMGGFEGAPEKIQYLAIGIAAATGLLAIISQYAAIREGKAVTEDLKKIQDPSHLGQKVAESGALLSLTTLVTLGIGAVIYGLVIYAVIG
jgi:hypothetical protein